MTQADSPRDAAILSTKVPLVTLYFWIIKIMATTVGETAADFLNFDMKLGLVKTSWLMAALLVVALIVQIAARRYVPWKYWLAVVFLSIFGTLVTDNLSDNYGVSLIVTTIGFSLALIATFVAWYMSEHTLSIHSIFTRKRELFYWTAILFTFALGTAAGDLLAERLALGYALSALLFGGAIALVTLAYYQLGLDSVWAFWIAYVLTRPFGASCGDLLSQAPKDGGLGLGTVGTSALFVAVIVALVGYLSYSRSDTLPDETSAPA
jgi:uncharacterized membrane-anchored protein